MNAPGEKYLVSAYALSVAVGALAVTAAVSRLDRKRALLGLMLLFIAGNLISAVAPSYEVLTEHGEDAKLLAGGHSLLPMMKLRLALPSGLIDIRNVPGTSYVGKLPF